MATIRNYVAAPISHSALASNTACAVASRWLHECGKVVSQRWVLPESQLIFRAVVARICNETAVGTEKKAQVTLVSGNRLFTMTTVSAGELSLYVATIRATNIARPSTSRNREALLFFVCGGEVLLGLGVF